MIIPIYQVDAFTNQLFSGNPAAVCPLEFWLSDEILQNIAAENNLSETAFFKKRDNLFEIRWFTPLTEVELCGHATLSAAYVLFNHLNFKGDHLVFESVFSGILEVSRNKDLLTLNFPVDHIEPALPPDHLIEALGKKPVEIWRGKTDYLLYFPSQEDIEEINPDFEILRKIETRGIIITAPGYDCDFVSRFFAPKFGINEDPVTGSAHTSLVPFWVHRMNKLEFEALQLSARGGYLRCQLRGDRVFIAGEATTYLTGSINLSSSILS
jgi:PhzF family phenazine biosynthesis protein